MKRFHVHVAVRDLQRSIRESFHTLESVPVFGEDTAVSAREHKSECCAPSV